MDSFTQSGIIICVIIIFTVILAIIERIFHRTRHQRRQITLDNYDRELSNKEILFLEDAYERLLAAKSITKTYPKWYGWFLALAYVPLMITGFAVCFWVGSEVINFLSQREALDEQVLVSEKLYFGPSALIFLFALIILPGWFLYAVSRRSARLSNYVALNSDIWGFDSDAVIARQADLLKHRVRSKELSYQKPLDVDVFLDGRNASYQRGCKKGFLVLSLFSVFFLCFDLQYSRKAYPDKIVSSGGYFNILNDNEYDLSLIGKVELNCSFYKNKPRAYYRLYSDDVEIMEIEVTSKSLDGLSQLNKLLRQQDTQILPHTKRNNGEVVRVYFDEECVNAISREIPGNETEIFDILKLSKI